MGQASQSAPNGGWDGHNTSVPDRHRALFLQDIATSCLPAQSEHQQYAQRDCCSETDPEAPKHASDTEQGIGRPRAGTVTPFVAASSALSKGAEAEPKLASRLVAAIGGGIAAGVGLA